MKTYQWESPQLKKKATICNYLMFVMMALVIMSLYWWSELLAFVFLASALICLIMTWHFQGKDKALKGEKKENG